ncbi:MAG: NifU family protein [Bacteroidia bacterium]|nr:NifU family protein [Bacteroidia bacterium]
MMIYTEITPNPSSLKFVVEKQLLERGSFDFPNQEGAEDSPLARLLFQFKFVEGVFIGQRFVTVTKGDAFAWEEVIPKVKETVRDFLASGQAVVTKLPEETEVQAGDDSETVQRIKQLLDENIRPAVAMDGGDVVFDSFEDGVVKLKMQGSCQGCPSSTMTLQMGIKGLLTRMVPGVREVQAV